MYFLCYNVAVNSKASFFLPRAFFFDFSFLHFFSVDFGELCEISTLPEVGRIFSPEYLVSISSVPISNPDTRYRIIQAHTLAARARVEQMLPAAQRRSVNMSNGGWLRATCVYRFRAHVAHVKSVYM